VSLIALYTAWGIEEGERESETKERKGYIRLRERSGGLSHSAPGAM
jgi:hypothetical protein